MRRHYKRQLGAHFECDALLDYFKEHAVESKFRLPVGTGTAWCACILILILIVVVVVVVVVAVDVVVVDAVAAVVAIAFVNLLVATTAHRILFKDIAAQLRDDEAAFKETARKWVVDYASGS